MRVILPVQGAPDELIRVLNDRLREMEALIQPATGTGSALPNVGTPGRFTAGTTDAQGRVIERSRLQVSDLPGGGYPTSQANDAQIAYASADLTLSGSYADVTGATITLAQAGVYLVTACVEFSIGSTNILLSAQLVANGSAKAQLATTKSLSTGVIQSASQQWIYTAAAAGEIVKLQGKKAGGAGADKILATDTSISVLWVSP